MAHKIDWSRFTGNVKDNYGTLKLTWEDFEPYAEIHLCNMMNSERMHSEAVPFKEPTDQEVHELAIKWGTPVEDYGEAGAGNTIHLFTEDQMDRFTIFLDRYMDIDDKLWHFSSMEGDYSRWLVRCAQIFEQRLFPTYTDLMTLKGILTTLAEDEGVVDEPPQDLVTMAKELLPEFMVMFSAITPGPDLYTEVLC